MDNYNAKTTSPIARVFEVFVKPRSYASAFYSLIAFPLGTVYFIFLAVGLSLGLGLALLWIGFLILAFVLIASWGLAAFERQQAIVLLDAKVPPMRGAHQTYEDFGQQLKSFLTNPVTWKAPLFLLLKFPLGVMSFVVMLTSLCLGFALLLAPIYYYWSPPEMGLWTIDSLPEALVASLMGAGVLLVALHVANAFGWIWTQLAVLLLGGPPTPAESETTTAEVG